MASNNESVARTFGVAAALCIVCSILVSGAAVGLRSIQEENKKLDVKKNLLLSAGLLESSSATKQEIEAIFNKFEVKLIDLKTGDERSSKDPVGYNQVVAARSPKSSTVIPQKKDIARIKRRAKVAKVFLYKEQGSVKLIVLPVHGKGLWSTMYGFLALAPDTRTVKGIGFYQHAETPGLGGEIDNPRWKAQWGGKKVLNPQFEPAFDVVKGTVNPKSQTVDYQVDGLSGATLTSNGVEGLVNYWLGKHGFGKYLRKFREGV